jgi:putative transposase
VPSLKFEILYGLVIIHHQSRKIIHFAVTTNPTAEWTIQQFRNATPYRYAPKYLIHDNDTIFQAKAFQRFLTSSGIISKRTSYRSPWQNAYAERVIGTIKRELLTQVIPLNQLHFHKILYEYITKYYNTDRTHQGLGGKTPVPSPTYLPTSVKETKLVATPFLNVLYHSYKKVA